MLHGCGSLRSLVGILGRTLGRTFRPARILRARERRHVMLLLFGLFLFLVGACLILLLPVLWGERIFHTYREGRAVNCPETQAPVSVRFDALRAAWSGLPGAPKLLLPGWAPWPGSPDPVRAALGRGFWAWLGPANPCSGHNGCWRSD